MYLGCLVKLFIQVVILFALLFVLILQYSQLLSNCIDVDLHHNLLQEGNKLDAFSQREKKNKTTLCQRALLISEVFLDPI